MAGNQGNSPDNYLAEHNHSDVHIINEPIHYSTTAVAPISENNWSKSELITCGKFFQVIGQEGQKLKCLCLMCPPDASIQISAYTSTVSNLLSHIKRRHPERLAEFDEVRKSKTKRYSINRGSCTATFAQDVDLTLRQMECSNYDGQFIKKATNSIFMDEASQNLSAESVLDEHQMNFVKEELNEEADDIQNGTEYSYDSRPQKKIREEVCTKMNAENISTGSISENLAISLMVRASLDATESELQRLEATRLINKVIYFMKQNKLKSNSDIML